MTSCFSISVRYSRIGKPISGGPMLSATIRRNTSCATISRKAFSRGKRYFHEHPEITAAELYAQKLAEKAGWEYGGPIAGHLIGVFPHEKIAGDKITLYVHPKNHHRMRTQDATGGQRHWILEIHFVDRARQIGG